MPIIPRRRRGGSARRSEANGATDGSAAAQEPDRGAPLADPGRSPEAAPGESSTARREGTDPDQEAYGGESETDGRHDHGGDHGHLDHQHADDGDESEEEGSSEEPDSSRVSVVRERDEGAPRDGDEEYRWHTGKNRPTGVPDAIEFVDVHKAFGRNKILRGLNLGIPEGKISMILGPSGTGKSVCIKHMVGLLYPDEGDVLVHGESVPNLADDDLFDMRKKFGVLFQDGALFGSMNLYDNVAFPLRQHTDKGEEEIAEIVDRRLDEVGLTSAGDKMPNELSGGMRKRAGFARALVLDPDIVLFDEPDSGLDPVRTALLCELIKEIHEENGGAYVVITHDIMSARRVAEHISVLWKGRIVESGPAEELFNSDNPFVRQFLSGESQGPLGME